VEWEIRVFVRAGPGENSKQFPPEPLLSITPVIVKLWERGDSYGTRSRKPQAKNSQPRSEALFLFAFFVKWVISRYIFLNLKENKSLPHKTQKALSIYNNIITDRPQ